MNNRTYLDITTAVIQFAKERGALFDRAKSAWYIVGEVHPELEEFLPQIPRLRDHSSEYGPACPKCGAHTYKKANKHGDIFWSCSCWPRCNGTVQWEEENLHLSNTFLDQEVNAPSSAATKNHAKRIVSIPLEVQDRVKYIVELAIKMHQSKFAALRWLETKKVALHLKTPLEVMHCLDGCDVAEQLLMQKFER